MFGDTPQVIVIELIIRVITGVIAAAIASSKGRSVVGWFFGGFFLFILGDIIIACLANLNEHRNFQARVDMENRRLREQLYQERIKTDSFRQYTQQRLDAHDQTLGMDTRSLGQIPLAAPPAQYLPPGQGGVYPVQPLDPYAPPAAYAGQVGQYAQPAMPEAQWYYEQAGQSIGPISGDRIRQLFATGQVLPTTLVWCESLSDWTPLAQIPQFAGSRAV